MASDSGRAAAKARIYTTTKHTKSTKGKTFFSRSRFTLLYPIFVPFRTFVVLKSLLSTGVTVTRMPLIEGTEDLNESQSSYE
jgi:hypothetical protein